MADDEPILGRDSGADPEHRAALIERYARLVERSRHNLLSARGLAELRSRHIPESLAFAAMLPAGPGRMLDVGSGGGLPGVVVAIARPDLEVHLLDATRKKVDFLRQATLELGLDVAVHHGRVEELARTAGFAAGYDLVTARAVAPLVRLIPLVVGLLSPGGALYAVKGERWAEELEEASSELGRWRAQVLATPDDQIPREATPNVVVIGRSG